jgi:hypothetical protein
MFRVIRSSAVTAVKNLGKIIIEGTIGVTDKAIITTTAMITRHLPESFGR